MTSYSIALFSVSQIKPWSELSWLVRVYFCFTIMSLLALLGLTISSIYKQHKNTDIFDEDNFTVSLILLIGICEYIAHLQQHLQEVDASV